MSKTDRILRYSIAVLLCAFVYVIFVTLHERIIQVGDSAPDFVFKPMAGSAEFANAGVVVLGVSVDKDEKAYRRFLSRVNVAFLTTRDPDNKINAEYGTFKFPETYIINRDGKVLSKIISATNWTDDKMMTYVRSLL